MLFAANKSNVHLLERIRDTLLSALATSGYKTEELLKLLKPAVEYEEPKRKRATRTTRKPATGAKKTAIGATNKKASSGAKKAGAKPATKTKKPTSKKK